MEVLLPRKAGIYKPKRIVNGRFPETVSFRFNIELKLKLLPIEHTVGTGTISKEFDDVKKSGVPLVRDTDTKTGCIQPETKQSPPKAKDPDRKVNTYPKKRKTMIVTTGGSSTKRPHDDGNEAGGSDSPSESKKKQQGNENVLNVKEREAHSKVANQMIEMAKHYARVGADFWGFFPYDAINDAARIRNFMNAQKDVEEAVIYQMGKAMDAMAAASAFTHGHDEVPGSSNQVERDTQAGQEEQLGGGNSRGGFGPSANVNVDQVVARARARARESALASVIANANEGGTRETAGDVE